MTLTYIDRRCSVNRDRAKHSEYADKFSLFDESLLSFAPHFYPCTAWDGGRTFPGVRTLSSTLFLFFSAAMTCVAAPSFAQEQPSSASTYAESVGEHVQRAQTARMAGRWAEAEASYEASLVAAGQAGISDATRAEIVGELGLCELQLRKHRDAAEHLSQALERRSALGPALQRRFGDGWQRAVKQVGTLYLAVDPPDAEVSVDGRVIGKGAPGYEIYLEPGIRTVRARLPAHADAEYTLDAVAGREGRISLRLPQALETPRPTPKAREAARPVSPAPEARSSTGAKLRTAGAIGAGASVAIGAGLLIWGALTEADLEERRAELRDQGWSRGECLGRPRPSACDELASDTDRRDVVSTIGLVGLIAGGAVGAVTIGSFLVVAKQKSDKKTVKITPATNGQQAAVMIRGVW